MYVCTIACLTAVKKWSHHFGELATIMLWPRKEWLIVPENRYQRWKAKCMPHCVHSLLLHLPQTAGGKAQQRPESGKIESANYRRSERQLCFPAVETPCNDPVLSPRNEWSLGERKGKEKQWGFLISDNTESGRFYSCVHNLSPS